ncbi:MAG: SIS domain-containing protein [Chthoniobacterales bacterium]
MDQPGDILRKGISDAHAAFDAVQNLEPQIVRAAHLITDCLTNGGKLLVCGNGGSAADAADFTTEFACRFAGDRRPYPALNLSQGGSLVTANGNDYGFDEIFARQVHAFGTRGDLLIAISTSGKSANIRRALEQATKQQLHTIALLGRDGGDCRSMAELEIIAPGNSTARIQETHKFMLHVLCEIAETRLPRS